jgi:hypothetical protein
VIRVVWLIEQGIKFLADKHAQTTLVNAAL